MAQQPAHRSSEEEEATLGKANSAESAQNRIESGLDEIDEQGQLQSYITSALTDLSTVETEMNELKARIQPLRAELKNLCALSCRRSYKSIKLCY